MLFTRETIKDRIKTVILAIGLIALSIATVYWTYLDLVASRAAFGK